MNKHYLTVADTVHLNPGYGASFKVSSLMSQRSQYQHNENDSSEESSDSELMHY